MMRGAIEHIAIPLSYLQDMAAKVAVVKGLYPCLPFYTAPFPPSFCVWTKIFGLFATTCFGPMNYV